MLAVYQGKDAEVLVDEKWLKQGVKAESEQEKEPRRVLADFIKKFFRHKGAAIGSIIILLFIFTAVFAPWLTSYEYDKPDINSILLAPSWKHLFGTDEFGRDIFTRILYGSRISLEVALWRWLSDGNRHRAGGSRVIMAVLSIISLHRLPT